MRSSKADEEVLVFAGLGPRFGAMIVDLVLALAWSSAFRPAYQSLFPDPPVLGSLTVSSLVAAAVFWGYLVVTTAVSGGTFGKHAFRLRVVSVDFKPPDWSTVFFREVVGRVIVAATALIGYLWVVVDERKQGWHDKIADTYVLKEVSVVLVPDSGEEG